MDYGDFWILYGAAMAVFFVGNLIILATGGYRDTDDEYDPEAFMGGNLPPEIPL